MSTHFLIVEYIYTYMFIICIYLYIPIVVKEISEYQDAPLDSDDVYLRISQRGCPKSNLYTINIDQLKMLK
jgi:hypothetical protein